MNKQKTETTTKIKNIDEFCKLYKVSIPVNEHFDYYVSILKRSNEFGYWPNPKLQKQIDDFIDLEKFVEENNLESVTRYKMKSLDKIKDYLLSTNAYKDFIATELPKEKVESRDWINQEDLHSVLISIDFSSANYSVLKTFDKTGELEQDWKSLCEKFDLHKALVNSKSFRQIVFGNTNPKRFQTIQHSKIMQVLSTLKEKYKIQDEDIVFIAHDEIILKVKTANTARYLMDAIDKYVAPMVNMPVKYTCFTLEKIQKNIFVKSICSINPAHAERDSYIFSEEYKTLHGVPGHKYFLFFKKYILKEETEERDLMYMNDGQLCQWVDGSVKVAKKLELPHYDRLEYSVKMDEAMVDYSYIWETLDKVVPGLKNEEKRRIIEVVANTCPGCHQAPAGCFCRRDD
jgi:hypothetical protein